MPLYEYYCTDCTGTFERLRPAQQADDPVNCPACASPASQRILSLFANSVKNSASDAAPAFAGGGMTGGMGGGCCGGGGCGCQVH